LLSQVSAVPVGPGGYVNPAARTPHYDGGPANQPDPAVIAVLGLGPLDMQLGGAPDAV